MDKLRRENDKLTTDLQKTKKNFLLLTSLHVFFFSLSLLFLIISNIRFVITACLEIVQAIL